MYEHLRTKLFIALSLFVVASIPIISLFSSGNGNAADLSQVQPREALHDGSHPAEQDNNITSDNPKYWMYLGISIFSVCASGIMSGLTLGLLSLSPRDLELLSNSGTPDERKHAGIILPIVKRHHWLLVTLLLINALFLEALPLFLDRIVSPAVAIILSVTAVLLFGEIIPQALCARHALHIGAFFAPLVRVLLIVSAPISYPLSRALDVILGEDHDTFMRRSQIKELIKMHSNEDGPLTSDEALVIKGAIELSHKIIQDAMTPLKEVFMLSWDAKFDAETMTACLSTGHSRLPIYRGDRSNIVGVLLVKQMIHCDPDDEIPISALEIRPIPHVINTTPMFHLLHFFQSGRSHMVVVVRDVHADDEDAQNVPRKTMGIITLEDVLEELLLTEIVDETDVFASNSKQFTAGEYVKALRSRYKDDIGPVSWTSPSGQSSRLSPRRKKSVRDFSQWARSTPQVPPRTEIVLPPGSKTKIFPTIHNDSLELASIQAQPIQEVSIIDHDPFDTGADVSLLSGQATS